MPRTLPRSVRTKALHAIAAIDAWNDAVVQARCMEKTAGCPGRYEYALMTDTEHMALDLARGHSLHALDLLEETVTTLGWSVAEFYATLGTPRPTVLPQGPHVIDWFQGNR